MLDPNVPALVLAPMDGITDAPMRALQGSHGTFTYAVSEFLRVSVEALPVRVFHRDVPELCHDGLTPTGLPVQVQILGGDPLKMAKTARNAVEAGAKAVDINFGCPAPTVNRNDGGASLLNHPDRIREIVRSVRDAVPADIPVSAKLRLGWDNIDDILRNAEMAAEGGASWLTIHARTRVQGYTPPVHWPSIGLVRQSLSIPIIANGDIWTIDDFRRCQDETGCRHFMLGRGALAAPALPFTIATELGLHPREQEARDWVSVLEGLLHWTEFYQDRVPNATTKRLKQWLKIASLHGGFDHFDQIKRTETIEDFFAALKTALEDRVPVPL